MIMNSLYTRSTTTCKEEKGFTVNNSTFVTREASTLNCTCVCDANRCRHFLSLSFVHTLSLVSSHSLFTAIFLHANWLATGDQPILNDRLLSVEYWLPLRNCISLVKRNDSCFDSSSQDLTAIFYTVLSRKRC